MADELGLIKALFFTLSAVLYFVLDYHLFRCFYLIAMVYLIGSNIFVYFLMFNFKSIPQKAQEAMSSACVTSSKLTLSFFSYYIIIAIGIFTPFFLGGQEISKTASIVLFFLELLVVVKMFSMSKKIKKEDF